MDSEIRRIVANFTLMNDELMAVVLADRACAELFLRIVLERGDLTVQKVQSHYELKNPARHTAILDVYATDRDGRVFNVEVQRSDAGAVAERARYYSSLIDTNSLEPGMPHSALPETYVIFVTENDVLKGGLPLYHIERTIVETGESFRDRSHIVYVNAQERGDTALGRLMQDFTCRDPRKMHYRLLADWVYYYKETEGGSESMCRAFEQLCDEREQRALKLGEERGLKLGEERGLKLGEERGLKLGAERCEAAIVKNLLCMGMPYAQITEATGLSPERIRAIEAGAKGEGE